MRKITFALSVLLLAVALTAPFSVFAATSAGVKPGSFWYGFDLFGEKINLFFTFNSEKKAKIAMEYADERLAEIEESAGNNKSEAVAKAMENYQENISLAVAETKTLKDEAKTETLLLTIASSTSKHQETLAGVLEKVPEEAKSAIQHAIEVSKKETEEITKQISELKKENIELKNKIEELEKKLEKKEEEKVEKIETKSEVKIEKEGNKVEVKNEVKTTNIIKSQEIKKEEVKEVAKNNIVTLPNGAVVEMGENGKIIKTIKEAPVAPIVSQTSIQPTSVILSGDEIMSRVAPSVVLVSTPCCTGSGFVVNEGRFVVTNAHVVNKENTDGQIVERYSIVDMTIYGNKIIKGTVLARDEITDLAIIATGSERPQSAILGLSDSSALKIGNDVFAMGYPKSLPNLTLTKGILSSRQILDEQSLLQTDTAINPGNSGGPLVNNKGEVIGVNVSRLKNSEAIGFAIPIDIVKKVIVNLSAGIEKFIFNPIAGSNVTIPRSMVVMIGLNPNSSCEALGNIGDNFKLCDLYKNHQSAYQWTIDENR